MEEDRALRKTEADILKRECGEIELGEDTLQQIDAGVEKENVDISKKLTFVGLLTDKAAKRNQAKQEAGIIEVTDDGGSAQQV